MLCLMEFSGGPPGGIGGAGPEGGASTKKGVAGHSRAAASRRSSRERSTGGRQSAMARAMVVRTDGPRRATRSTLEERARASVRTVAAAVRPVGPSQRIWRLPRRGPAR
eukprot:scaffold5477_cov124-Isochrysis_galbana.AAC.11